MQINVGSSHAFHLISRYARIKLHGKTSDVCPSSSPPRSTNISKQAPLYHHYYDYARSLLLASVARTMGLDRTQALLAALAAFVAWALLTDWLPSLRWIPHAFLTGALTAVAGVLFVIATTSRGVAQDRPRKRKGHVVWKDKEVWEEEKAALRALGPSITTVERGERR